ncbi:MAG TPA: cytochrome c oxidase subunit 3, partial [Polyangiaceae bacterium]|nr:cytochrome c oxidase subunit 3 [Polyangiaceae bacterium]
RDPRWVAVVLLIAIEATVFGLMVFTYFYTRGRLQVWPPTSPGPRELRFGAAVLVALLLSAFTTHLINRELYGARLLNARRLLVATTVLSLVALGLRAVELSHLPFRWDSNVFGSIFWGLLCLHTMHLIAGNFENLLFLVLLYRGPIEKKHLVDLEVNGVYWYFVVFSWLPLYAILYLDGALPW